MSTILTRHFNLLHIVATSLIVLLATFTCTYLWEQHKVEREEKQLASEASSYACNFDVKRLEGYNLIKPLLFVDQTCESHDLEGVKQKVSSIIDRYKTANDAANASVYLKTRHGWITINDDEQYMPGSLFKVPILISILKMNEDHPGFLDQRFVFEKPFDVHKKINFPSKTIEIGKSYTVHELLRYMIQYSDNNATLLLETHMDSKVLQKLFVDLGLQAPNLYADNFYFTARDYSLFMRAIYNASYLTIKDSEYAAELLTLSEFHDGIASGIPGNVKLAHKFGEAGDNEFEQLHESAIVYLDKTPYLLTIMTKGKDLKKLSELISQISNSVYLELSNTYNGA